MQKKFALARLGVLGTGALMLGMISTGATQAALLTFDDVPGGSVQGEVGDMPTYQGFNFSFTLDWIDLVGSIWPFGAHSGEFGILNNNGGTGTITAVGDADFTFDGIWAKSWATQPESGGGVALRGTLQGFNNGNQVWSVDTGLNGSYQFFGPQAGAIDQLNLSFGNVFLADDLSLNAGTGPSIPEPGTLALLAAGLVGIGLAQRRKPG